MCLQHRRVGRPRRGGGEGRREAAVDRRGGAICGAVGGRALVGRRAVRGRGAGAALDAVADAEQPAERLKARASEGGSEREPSALLSRGSGRAARGISKINLLQNITYLRNIW